MLTKKPQPKIPKEDALRMAVAAVEGNRKCLDMPVAGVDVSPSALDLPEELLRCRRCALPTVETCPTCGFALCDDCGLA
jgi:hypothetical protein